MADKGRGRPGKTLAELKKFGAEPARAPVSAEYPATCTHLRSRHRIVPPAGPPPQTAGHPTPTARRSTKTKDMGAVRSATARGWRW